MAQKKNLNISPYYDDFDKSKNFYKVLFKPGFPVQARELTTLQSILQNQVETFGDGSGLKEGSVVIPGSPNYQSKYNSVKLNSSQFGVDISLYVTQLIGKTVKGQTSGITATVESVALPDGNNVEDITIYVKYIAASNIDFTRVTFLDGESLLSDENIIYGTTTISAGSIFATLVSSNATAIGSAASVDEGVYYIRGNFVNVDKQTIILDHYTNTPSYRVGLKIDESVIRAKDDNSLYDNAKGFSNYAAPGADRLKIGLTLTKKVLSDTNDTDFVEIMRIQDGEVKKFVSPTSQKIDRNYIAGRTQDESGDYVVDEFDITVNNSLNDRLDSNGIYYSNQNTHQGNTPSDNLMCVTVSPGKAYVNGYDVAIHDNMNNVIDVDKPRDVGRIPASNIDFSMGNVLKVNNVSGQPQLRKEIKLFDSLGSTGTEIGDARVYSIHLTGSSEVSPSSKWNVHLYDIQTYTILTLTQEVSATDVPNTTYVKGFRSGATGYVISRSSTNITLRQTSGSFMRGEQVSFNGAKNPAFGARTITEITAYGARDVRSIKQSADGSSGYPVEFKADSFLEPFPLPNRITKGTINNTAGTLVSPGRVFGKVPVGTIIRYQTGSGDETFNKVVAISSDARTLYIAAHVGDVSGVYQAAIGGDGTYDIEMGIPTITKRDGLYVKLPDPNISSVDLSNSILPITTQITGKDVTSNSIQVSLSDIKDGNDVGISSAFFEAYQTGRYSIFYGGSTGIGTVSYDSMVRSSGNSTITFTGLSNSNNNSVVNITATKQGIQSKIKNYEKSQILNITRSRNPESGTTSGNSLQDGLTYNNMAYGLRVQDEYISLNVPDVVKILAVYESKNSSAPTLDVVTFTSTANVGADAIIGETIRGENSNAIARIITNNNSSSSSGGANSLGIVYLNDKKLITSENVLFEESQIVSSIESIQIGNYNDISRFYSLDGGQRDEYYDYSRLVRKNDSSIPSKQLMVIFDMYTVPSDDTGDAFTVLSYDRERYTKDIPLIGDSGVRATDTLDFRPRVTKFNGAGASPFDFSQRNFDNIPKYLLAPNESTNLGYDYYLGRIDSVYLSQYGNVSVEKGQPSRTPLEPANVNNLLKLANIILPPYLYDPRDAEFLLVDNRRYTMRDIGVLEDRLDELERVTTLSLLETSTQSLTIQDANGNSRFKSGFFVDNFNTDELIDDASSISVDTDSHEIRPIVSRNSIINQLLPGTNIDDKNLKLESDYALLDSNVKKTGNVVTLNYEPIPWIEQTYATKQQNINPFNVAEYVGDVVLTPDSDTWVRTIRLEDVEINKTVSKKKKSGFGWGSNKKKKKKFSTVTEDVLVDSGDEIWMRSRNVRFNAEGLRANELHYQFLDGNDDVHYIPKLLEISPDSSLSNYGSDSSLNEFKMGETVTGYSDDINGEEIISFRLAKSDHKQGDFNNPSRTYSNNPYFPEETLQANYTTSSKVLNIDTFSLASEEQGLYSGYVEKGTKLVGHESGATAYVKDLRLITDINGNLQGCFFLKDPLTTPPPSVRIETGKKTYKLSSSPINSPNVKNSESISSASTPYEAVGTWEERQLTTTNTTTNNTKGNKGCVFGPDPLAQTFSVGGLVEAPDPNFELDADDHGVFITSVDVFFALKSNKNATVRCEIRTVELGKPTTIRIGKASTKTPEEVTTSVTGDVATNFEFPEPIYLSAGKEYAIVLLAPASIEYEVFIAEYKMPTIATQELPRDQQVLYSQQWALGSLFKSQNGSIWSESQLEDLKFKLYKAKFSTTPGTAFFANPTLDKSNGYVTELNTNPITTFSKKGYIGINTVYDNTGISSYSRGRTVIGHGNDDVKGVIVGTGSSVITGTVSIASSGFNYKPNMSNYGPVGVYNIVGQGRDLKLNITSNEEGLILQVDTHTTNVGHGYTMGDRVGIITADTDGNIGRGAEFSIGNIKGVDTLYLDDIHGSPGSNGFKSGEILKFIADGATTPTSTNIDLTTDLVLDGGVNSGEYFKINDELDHGMYASNNKVIIKGVASDVDTTKLSNDLDKDEASSLKVDSAGNLSTFEGLPVSATNPGYIRIENEIISYKEVKDGNILFDLGRGVNSTSEIDTSKFHSATATVEKYELNGVSLLRINKTHTISMNGMDLDNYGIEIDKGATGTIIKDRSSTGTQPELSFNISESPVGGSNATASRNILYDTIAPIYDVFTPSDVTSASASIRTVSGTSIGGNENSFVDQGFEPVQLNRPNKLNSVRLICSKVNEDTYLTNIERNKSLTTGVLLSTTNESVSPLIYLDNSSTEFRSNRLNNPVSNYITDNRVNSRNAVDPHTAMYISPPVTLDKPADGLKVLLSAYRDASSDFRVLYSIKRPDSDEIPQEFELFPGYDNLNDTTGDGFGDDVIDVTNNDGKPDAFVPASLDNQFLDYQFTADNIGEFVGYQIKIVMSGTNQAYPVRIKDIRTIALK